MLKILWIFTVLKVTQFLTSCRIPHSLSLSLVNSHIVLFCKHIFWEIIWTYAYGKSAQNAKSGINKVFSLSAWKSSEYHKNKTAFTYPSFSLYACMHVHCISCLGCNRLNPTSITTHMTKFVLSSETRFYLENVVSVKDTSHIVLVIFQCTHHLQNKKDRLLQTSVIQLYLKHLPEENLRFSATWSFKRPHD